MKISIQPVKFELHEGSQLMATVSMFDECSCEVEIKTMVTPQSWSELAAGVSEALRQIDSPKEIGG